MCSLERIREASSGQLSMWEKPQGSQEVLQRLEGTGRVPRELPQGAGPATLPHTGTGSTPQPDLRHPPQGACCTPLQGNQVSRLFCATLLYLWARRAPPIPPCQSANPGSSFQTNLNSSSCFSCHSQGEVPAAGTTCTSASGLTALVPVALLATCQARPLHPHWGSWLLF